MTTTLFQLMTALVHGLALHAAGLKAVLAVEREDAMRYDDPSSATRRTGGADCNRDGPPPFAATHGYASSVCPRKVLGESLSILAR